MFLEQDLASTIDQEQMRNAAAVGLSASAPPAAGEGSGIGEAVRRRTSRQELEADMAVVAAKIQGMKTSASEVEQGLEDFKQLFAAAGDNDSAGRLESVNKVLAKGKNLIKDMEELYRTQRAMMAYLLVDVD